MEEVVIPLGRWSACVWQRARLVPCFQQPKLPTSLQHPSDQAAGCQNPRVAAQVAEVGEGAEGQVMCGSVEVGGNGTGGGPVWWMCSVEEEVSHKPPLQVRFATEVRNHLIFVRSDDGDEEGECQDCMAWPVVGKGGKVSKGGKGELW